jgi:hypothetical protein
MISQIENNLLLKLHKWAKRQNENFHTEALAHLLRHLIQHEPVAAVNILKAITGGALDSEPENVTSISINTQITTLRGFHPDIEIRTSNHLSYVEVKIESGLHKSQLEEYRKALDESGFRKTSLILLTQNSFIPESGEVVPDTAIRWYRIAELLADELSYGTIKQPTSRYVTEQFLEFLKKRELTVELERVGEEFTQGIQVFLSLRNLLEMVRQVLILNNASSIELDVQWDWIGYFFKFDFRWYWIGLRYDRPNVLLVEIDEIDPSIYKKLNLGYVDYSDEYEYWYWIHELNLSAEDTRFFELSKSDQFQRIEQFLKDNYETIKQLPS